MTRKPKKAKPVKAWGLRDDDTGNLIKEAYQIKESALYYRQAGCSVVRVEIREVRGKA